MERPLKPYDKECMKLAILKHEQTFKEQVFELHRLYRIQKTLMRSIDRERLDSGNRIRTWQMNGYDHHRYLHHHHHHRRDHDSDQGPRMTSAKEWALGSDRVDRIPEIDEGDGECEIELTLGPSSYNPRKKSGTPLTSDSGRSLSSSSTGSSHAASECCGQKQHPQQQQQHPPWLFQVLSLNLT